MQALHFNAPREIFWKELALPSLVEPTDAVVRPIAVAACDLDRGLINGRVPFPGPFVLGHEFTAEVMKVGEGTASIKVGDLVLASFQPSCGHCGRCDAGHSSVCRTVPATSMYGIGAAGGDWSGAFADRIRVPWADYNLRRIPEGSTRILASGSDNLADGLRCVDDPLSVNPGASVLVLGQGSIALYAVLCAQFLGAGEVRMASVNRANLTVAEKLGAEAIEVGAWPDRFKSADITIDCTGDERGLVAALASTSGYGICTSPSIYFSNKTAVPLRTLYMKGITFHTGRVNSAAQLDRVLELVADGLDPDRIQPQYIDRKDAIAALLDAPESQKLIIDM